ncbi:TIGR00341 family protein [Methanotorris formicicus]|uniref:Uncharacterized hydrophobic domain protein n=1 Tax=Methanotorris formicicus Mc-S-70 TaxID=647171 RepID=H1L1F4_9EURY|nr:TIGR00341 family protein [Methanotorris formicicus]EHP83769.1 uncharacterized hydrophobic domain protein [Methanotorris formicicus Mc-S-70]
MKLRFIVCYIPKHLFVGIDKLKGDGVIWISADVEGSYCVIKILSTLKDAEQIIDKLNQIYGGANFRIVVFEPTTTIPPIEEIEKEKIEEGKPERLSRQEMYNMMIELSKFSKEIFLMTILSAIVASVGIWKDNVAIIIASMVIAPLLGPNMALSFSITVADLDLARKCIKTLLLEIFVVILLAILLGYFNPVSLDSPQIHSRIFLGIWDIIALSAGIAGALTVISEVSSAVVGVMIAIALLPPLVVFGLLIGSGHFNESIPLLILFLINIIGINLSAILVFHAYGISPYRWWKREMAKKYTIFAMAIWFLLLVIMTLLIIFKFYHFL